METAKKQIAAANKANKAITEQVNELNGKVSELEAANEELEKNPKGILRYITVFSNIVLFLHHITVFLLDYCFSIILLFLHYINVFTLYY